jgi:hypothetical protein
MNRIDRIKNKEAARVLLVTADNMIRTAFEKMYDAGMLETGYHNEILSCMSTVISLNTQSMINDEKKKQ